MLGPAYAGWFTTVGGPFGSRFLEAHSASRYAKFPYPMYTRRCTELHDVVGVIPSELGGDLELFAGGVVRNYMNVLRHDATLARRIAKRASSEDAKWIPRWPTRRDAKRAIAAAAGA